MRCLKLLLSLSLLACGGAPPKPKPVDKGPEVSGAKTGPFKAQAKLQWMPDASYVLVDGHLRFEPATGEFSPVTGTREGWIPTLGPAGERAYFDGSTVQIGEAKTPVPTWIEGADDARAVGYWASDDRLYVHQYTKSQADCRMFDVQQKAWKVAAAECLDPGQWWVESLTPGPGHLVYTHTSNDGAPDLRILRYDPRQGQGETMARLKATADALPIVTFTADGGTARVVTTCKQPDGPCGQKPTLYHFDLYDKAVQAVGEVDAGAVPAPVGEDLIWVHHGALCVGRAGGPVRCFAP